MTHISPGLQLQLHRQLSPAWHTWLAVQSKGDKGGAGDAKDPTKDVLPRSSKLVLMRVGVIVASGVVISSSPQNPSLLQTEPGGQSPDPGEHLTLHLPSMHPKSAPHSWLITHGRNSHLPPLHTAPLGQFIEVPSTQAFWQAPRKHTSHGLQMPQPLQTQATPLPTQSNWVLHISSLAS